MHEWLAIIKLSKIPDLWQQVELLLTLCYNVFLNVCVGRDRDRENARPMCASIQLNNRCPNLENAWRRTMYGVWSERNHSTL